MKYTKLYSDSLVGDETFTSSRLSAPWFQDSFIVTPPWVFDEMRNNVVESASLLRFLMIVMIIWLQ